MRVGTLSPGEYPIEGIFWRHLFELGEGWSVMVCGDDAALIVDCFTPVHVRRLSTWRGLSFEVRIRWPFRWRWIEQLEERQAESMAVCRRISIEDARRHLRARRA